ncbi:hypothetical protein BRC81_07535 [Halobacteriales archaeon QS_1_68_20]|nr:MAG: hypothetical protein BRC81_07535 [Halobacteriales archaeon QS_1_68_20]
MNRRNALIGLGSLAVGGGALFGSGAFSQVQADRTASFSVTNDGSALLGLSGDGSYVTETNTGPAGASTIEFQFTKLNDNASSTFEGVLTITNNTQDGADKSVYIQDDGTVTAGGVIDFVDSAGTEGSIVGSANAATLAAGDSITCDVVIDTTQGDPSTVSTVTIVGE